MLQMEMMAVRVKGTVTPDGKLEVAEHLDVAPGPVEVTIKALARDGGQPKESVWVILERIRADREARGMRGRTKEEIDADIRAMREEWDEHQEAIEALQARLHEERQGRAC